MKNLLYIIIILSLWESSIFGLADDKAQMPVSNSLSSCHEEPEEPEEQRHYSYLPFVTTSIAFAASQSTSSQWPMFQANLQHTGQTSHSGPDTPTLCWEFPVQGTPGSPSIAQDGTIYLPVGAIFTAEEGMLHAINPDGTEKWQLALNCLPNSTVPAIGPDDTIYVHCNDGQGSFGIEMLHAITKKGKIRWTYKFFNNEPIPASEIQSSPAVLLDGTIYVASMDTQLYALNPDGTLRWARSPTMSSFDSSPSVDTDGNVYIFNGDGLFSYTSEGAENWRFSFDVFTGSSVSPVIGPDGSIYIVYDGTDLFYAVNSDGTEKWSHALNRTSSPAVANDGTIYLSADRLYAFSPGGSILWTASEPSSQVAPIIDANGVVYARGAGAVYAINPDGTEKWHIDAASQDSHGMALANDGTLLIPTLSSLMAFR